MAPKTEAKGFSARWEGALEAPERMDRSAKNRARALCGSRPVEGRVDLAGEVFDDMCTLGRGEPPCMGERGGLVR